MQKQMTVYLKIGWQTDFQKGDGWQKHTLLPGDIATSKQNIKDNGLDLNDWVKVKITFEELL